MVKLKEYGKTYNGKHDGWAFQFLNDDYEGIHLGVCCKDFLQDIVWSELTQKEMEIYHQKSNYQGIINKQDVLKLCMYPYLFNNKYEPIIENLEELGVNLQAFLNEIEILREYELSTVTCDDNKLVILFSKQWIEKPYLLSLFTLLCRIGLWYNGDLDSYISNINKINSPYFDTEGLYYITGNKHLLLHLLNDEGELDQCDWSELTTSNKVHESGIFSNIHLYKRKKKHVEESC